MSFVCTLVGFGVRQALDLDDKVELGIITAVQGHFTDHAQTLPKALLHAHDRAWQALGYALAGNNLLDRFRGLFASGDDKGFREEVRLFLNERARAGTATPEQLRQECLADLQRLRKSGQLSPQALVPEEVARAAAKFGRYSEMPSLIEGASRAVEQIAIHLEKEYPKLANLLKQVDPGRPPLLVAAFSFFFRREVEKNDELANGLMVDGLRRLAQAQARAMSELDRAMEQMGRQLEEGLEEILGGLQVVIVTTQQTQSVVEQISRDVQQLLTRTAIPMGAVQPQYAVSIRSGEERRAVQLLLERFRTLSGDDQSRFPEVLNDLGKLLHGAGDARRAEESFLDAAKHTDNKDTRAESLFNAYRSALESKNFDVALEHLNEAAMLAPLRFAPFPTGRYQPRRILGAGGFGVVFHCFDHNFQEEVAVKSLHSNELDRAISDVFTEARILHRIHHPSIIGVRDCEFADSMSRSRPYIVMDFFDGVSLQTLLERDGLMTLEQLLPIARAIAEGMMAAHACGILHRDLKPDNVLVRKASGGASASREEWEVRIIDFGLALRRETIQTTVARRSSESSMVGDSVAGTMKFAPPEQMGELVDGKRIEPGTYSDVFAFGKLCCQALFGTTEPRNRQLDTLHPQIKQLLEDCIDHSLVHRIKTFDVVLERLDAGQGKKPEQPIELVRVDDAQAETARRQEAEREAAKREQAEREMLVMAERLMIQNHGTLTVNGTEILGRFLTTHKITPDRGREIVRQARENYKRNPTARKPGDVIDVGLAAGVNIRLAWMPPGTFAMGSPEREEKRDADEGPVHKVTLSKGFWMGVYPVTQQQWQLLMGSNPSKFKGDNRPVEQITWQQAHDCARAAGKVTGKTFRLPTEAEWEYACRAGTTTVFSFGNAASSDQANFDGNYPYGGAGVRAWRNSTSPVGSFHPNAWGLHDMHGNVWEWCSDWYAADYFQTSPDTDPQGPSKGDSKVIRGGSWFSWGWSCRSASRDKSAINGTPGNVGVRLVIEE